MDEESSALSRIFKSIGQASRKIRANPFVKKLKSVPDYILCAGLVFFVAMGAAAVVEVKKRVDEKNPSRVPFNDEDVFVVSYLACSVLGGVVFGLLIWPFLTGIHPASVIFSQFLSVGCVWVSVAFERTVQRFDDENFRSTERTDNARRRRRMIFLHGSIGLICARVILLIPSLCPYDQGKRVPWVGG